MSRVLAAHRRAVDVAIAAAIAAGMVVDTVLTDPHGAWWANLLCSLAVGAGLLWRRRAPLVPLVVFLVVAFVQNLSFTTYDDAITPIVALIVIGASVGRNADNRQLGFAVPLAIAGAIAVTAAMDNPLGDTLFPLFVLGASGAVGAGLRNREIVSRRLADRAHELEASRERREQEAVLAERRRIARDLHDVVAYTVSVMVVQAGAARRTLERDPEQALAALAAVEANGRGALVELRRLLGLLRPDGGGVPHAPQPGMAGLNDLIARARAAGLPVELDVDGEPGTLPAGVDLAAYRVVQESLTNTLKHAGPARARVHVRWEPDDLVLMIDDSGQGPAAEPEALEGQGIVGMRERVAMCGGELQLGRRRGGGFEVKVRLPRARSEVAA